MVFIVNPIIIIIIACRSFCWSVSLSACLLGSWNDISIHFCAVLLFGHEETRGRRRVDAQLRALRMCIAIVSLSLSPSPSVRNECLRQSSILLISSWVPVKPLALHNLQYNIPNYLCATSGRHIPIYAHPLSLHTIYLLLQSAQESFNASARVRA